MNQRQKGGQDYLNLSYSSVEVYKTEKEVLACQSIAVSKSLDKFERRYF
jgi:hypothetical protein